MRYNLVASSKWPPMLIVGSRPAVSNGCASTVHFEHVSVWTSLPFQLKLLSFDSVLFRGKYLPGNGI